MVNQLKACETKTGGVRHYAGGEGSSFISARPSKKNPAKLHKRVHQEVKNKLLGHRVYTDQSRTETVSQSSFWSIFCWIFDEAEYRRAAFLLRLAGQLMSPALEAHADKIIGLLDGVGDKAALEEHRARRQAAFVDYIIAGMPDKFAIGGVVGEQSFDGQVEWLMECTILTLSSSIGLDRGAGKYEFLDEARTLVISWVRERAITPHG